MNTSKPIPSSTTTALSTAATAAIAYLAGIGWDLTSIDWSLAINWLIGLTGVGAVTGLVTSDRTTTNTVEDILNDRDSGQKDNRPLGIRNNNPGNIRPLNRGEWLGQTGTNKNFVTFSEPLYGLRAMARNLMNQKRIHRLDTLEDMLFKYAPPIENDTDSYIAFVSAKTAIDPKAQIDFENSMVLLPVMRAMIKMENGQNPYSDELIKQAIQIA